MENGPGLKVYFLLWGDIPIKHGANSIATGSLPFCCQELQGGQQKMRTKSIKDCANPVWVRAPEGPWKMGVSQNRDAPKWMVYNGNPYKNG